MTTFYINNIQYSTDKEQTILEACTENNIFVPTLCFLKSPKSVGGCRVCLVKVENFPKPLPSCMMKVTEGMKIFTDTEEVITQRKKSLLALASSHRFDCSNCLRQGKCNFKKLLEDNNITPPDTFLSKNINSSNCICLDTSKCIGCKRCEAVCARQGINAIKCQNVDDRRVATFVNTNAEKCEIGASLCIGCGQCTLVCPNASLSELSQTAELEKILDGTDLKVAVIAPASKAVFAEMFKPATEKQLVCALKRLGFDKVFDLSLGADITALEEATELEHRIKHNQNLPMFSSCCPSWVNFAHKFYSDIVPNLSSTKTPQENIGICVKTYFADQANIAPSNIKVVSITPCTAKKDEILLKPTIRGEKEVDLALTLRELARVIDQKNIAVNSLPEMEYDDLLGTSSTLGNNFGQNGGVLCAIAGTIAQNAGAEFNLTPTEITEEYATYLLHTADRDYTFLAVSGTGNMHKVLEEIKAKTITPVFVEVMACVGGCVNGGGVQRAATNATNLNKKVLARKNALAKISAKKPYSPKDNPDVIAFYNYLNSLDEKISLHNKKSL